MGRVRTIHWLDRLLLWRAHMCPIGSTTSLETGKRASGNSDTGGARVWDVTDGPDPAGGLVGNT